MKNVKFVLEKIKKGEKIYLLSCKHIFHFNCLILYFVDKIDTHYPLCKYDILKILDGKEIDL